MIELTTDHRYICDGAEVPGFTHIAQTMGLVKYFNTDSFYLERGSAIHLATAYMDRGILNLDSVDPRIMGFLQAYQQFNGDHAWDQWEHIEEPLFHPTYRYCGCPDRWSDKCLLDIKGVQGYPIQLEAYAELLRANGYDPGRQGYMLHLKEDGKYKIETHKYDRRLLGVFLSAVSVFHYRKEKGLI